MEPLYGWTAGEPWEAAAETKSSRRRPHTYWGISEKVHGKKFFFENAVQMLERLEAASEFIRDITDTGGEVSINVNLYGRENIRDVLSVPALMRFAAMKVRLGVEVFPVKQRGW